MNRNIIRLFLICLLPAALAGCRNDETSLFDNKVFISASSYAPELRVQVDENVSEMSYDLTVGMAKPLEEDITVFFRMDKDRLDNYRHGWYNETAQLLPDANCDFSSLRTVIEAGNITGNALRLDFTGLDALDWSTDYVMPLSISDASGVDVLESARTVYIVIKKASLINVVADINDNLAWVDWKNKAPLQNMEQFTMEVLVNANSFTNEEISTIMGIEDNFLIRVGDNGRPKNQLNIAYGKHIDGQELNARGSLFVDSPLLETGRWYHIAVTFDKGALKIYVDGRLVAGKQATVNGGELLESLDFTTGESVDGTGRPDEDDGRPRAFWFGYSYDSKRDFDGMVAEARIWNCVLSEEEINAEGHFYKVPASSEGLVAYWKFNDESGDEVRDWSTSGNNLKGDHSFLWVNLELPE